MSEFVFLFLFFIIIFFMSEFGVQGTDLDHRKTEGCHHPMDGI